MKKLSVIFTVAIAMLFVSNPAFAEGISVPADGTAGDAGWVAVGAGLAIGLAALGGALGQGNTAKKLQWKEWVVTQMQTLPFL